jgi:2-succinyl-5-enolpyruvyl-6-hydroxy-3-cyclohexene-1-carboxylate synthase
MSSGADTTLWIRAFCDELARAGVRDVVVAPGSRSTPLVLAFDANDHFNLRVHLDERSAAFFALGIGKASGMPAVLVTTSGTATANAFPAVIEAAQSEAPLLVLTADRPHHLRDSDANQAIDQLRLFGPYARAFFEVAPPVAEASALRHLRVLAARAVAAAKGAPAGPVHVNFPLAKPLEPSEGQRDLLDENTLAAAGRSSGKSFVQVDSGRRQVSTKTLDALLDALDTPRGVIVAGPSSDPVEMGEAALRLAATTGFPLLADPLSGARFAPSRGAHVVAGYDLLLRPTDVCAALAPSLVLRVGASPTSTALMGWLRHNDGVRHIVIDGGGRWKDHGGTSTDYVHADAADTLAALAERAGPGASDDWQALWRSAESAVLEVVQSTRGEPHEGDVLATVSAAMPKGANLFVSSSMPVRDLDAFGVPRNEIVRVFANRGASGIDGIVSTAFGVAAATSGPTVCVIGDVAFFHDQNGLLWSREPDARVVFILIDNDGGGIFHMLPIAEYDPAFTKYFATPHGLDFRHVAEMHDIVFTDSEIGGLDSALAIALESGRTSIVRVRTNRETNTRRHRETSDAVAEAVRKALKLPLTSRRP